MSPRHPAPADWPPDVVRVGLATSPPSSVPPGDATTGYARYWLSLVGPSTTLAYLHLRTHVGERLPLDEMAKDLGLGPRIRNALHRGVQFGLLTPTEGGVAVADRLPVLTEHQRPRLRPELARQERAHLRLLRADRPTDPALRRAAGPATVTPIRGRPGP